jgi:hypothetical protein
MDALAVNAFARSISLLGSRGLACNTLDCNLGGRPGPPSACCSVKAMGFRASDLECELPMSWRDVGANVHRASQAAARRGPVRATGRG